MASSTSTAESIAKELSEQYGNLVPYSPPDWASRLNQVPTHRYVVSAYLACMALVIEHLTPLGKALPNLHKT